MSKTSGTICRNLIRRDEFFGLYYCRNLLLCFFFVFLLKNWSIFNLFWTFTKNLSKTSPGVNCCWFFVGIFFTYICFYRKFFFNTVVQNGPPLSFPITSNDCFSYIPIRLPPAEIVISPPNKFIMIFLFRYKILFYGNRLIKKTLNLLLLIFIYKNLR